MLIHFTPLQEQELYCIYLHAVTSGEWGPYDALTPTQKLCIFYRQMRGGMWVSNDLLVWSILTLVMVVACSITIFVFQA